MLITAGADGLSFWHVAQRRLLRQIPPLGTKVVQRAPGGQDLLIAGKAGLERRACSFDVRRQDLTLGASEQLCTNEIATATLSPDGHTLLAENTRHFNYLLLDPARTDQPRALEVRAHDTPISLSPDGKLCATGNWNGPDVTVWDVASARPVKV
jgi:hypothetical protein